MFLFFFFYLPPKKTDPNKKLSELANKNLRKALAFTWVFREGFLEERFWKRYKGLVRVHQGGWEHLSTEPQSLAGAKAK